MRTRQTFNIESCRSDYQIAYPSFMASFAWAAILTVAVVAGSFALACVAPLCALAVVLAATLGLRGSLGVMIFVWLVNQVIGFTLFHFPRTADSFLRGLALGAAAMLITIVARGVMRRGSAWRASVRVSVALVVTFAVYEATLFGAALVLGGREMFTLPIVSQIGLINGAWLVAIIVLNEVVAALCKPWLGRIPMVVRSPGVT